MKTGRLIKIAFTGLGRNRMRSFLMMIGVVIGITALTMVVAAALGAQERIVDRVKQFGYETLMVRAGGDLTMGTHTGGGEVITLKIEDAQAIKRDIDSVIEVAPFNRIGREDAVYSNRSVQTPLFGVPPEWSTVWNWNVIRGDFISRNDMERMARVCVIGPTVQQELFGEDDPLGEIIRVGNVPFEVIGVMEPRGISAGGGDMDNRVFIPLSTFKRRVANVDHIYGIRILLGSDQDADQAVTDITALLRERHRLALGVTDDFSIRSAEEVQAMVEGMLGTFNLFLILVAGISLIAGGVVVANIMLISVNERRREIGLRKAVGARSRDITVQFLFEAMAVTFTGGVMGMILGGVGSALLETLAQTPTTVSWEIVMVGVVFSILVGILAGLQPARRAAVLQPVDSLKS
ncbi:MAG: ABC transporter permease [Balneolales bacterium]